MYFVASFSGLYRQYFALVTALCVFSCYSLCLWYWEKSFGFGKGTVVGLFERGRDLQ